MALKNFKLPPPPPPPKKIGRGPNMALKITDLGTTLCLHRKMYYLPKFEAYIKIAIRGDGKSPDQKVIDMQLQAANLVYIFDVIILSVTANKSGRLTVETSFLPLNSQASSYKVRSREITYKSSKGEQQFLNARHPLDLLYIYTIYYQNISKDIKVIERTSFPL